MILNTLNSKLPFPHFHCSIKMDRRITEGIVLASVILGADFLQVKSPLLADPRSEVCLSEKCIINAADLLKQMDRNVDPCQDFFKFACGGFIADTVLPDRTGFFVLQLLFRLLTFPFLGPLDVLRDQLNKRLKKVFEAEPAAAEPSIYQGRVHL